jgi:hypothetical protein
MEHALKKRTADGHGHQVKKDLGILLFTSGDGLANVYVKSDRNGLLKEARIIF